jgi:hypothetical protein
MPARAACPLPFGSPLEPATTASPRKTIPHLDSLQSCPQGLRICADPVWHHMPYPIAQAPYLWLASPSVLPRPPLPP